MLNLFRRIRVEKERGALRTVRFVQCTFDAMYFSALHEDQLQMATFPHIAPLIECVTQSELATYRAQPRKPLPEQELVVFFNQLGKQEEITFEHLTERDNWHPYPRPSRHSPLHKWVHNNN